MTFHKYSSTRADVKTQANLVQSPFISKPPLSIHQPVIHPFAHKYAHNLIPTDRSNAAYCDFFSTFARVHVRNFQNKTTSVSPSKALLLPSDPYYFIILSRCVSSESPTVADGDDESTQYTTEQTASQPSTTIILHISETHRPLNGL